MYFIDWRCPGFSGFRFRGVVIPALQPDQFREALRADAKPFEIMAAF